MKNQKPKNKRSEREPKKKKSEENFFTEEYIEIKKALRKLRRLV